jgi:hypothetical protein
VAATQVYGAQLAPTVAVHAPRPSQVHCSGDVPLQSCALHVVPGVASWQLPWPSQRPSLPHVVVTAHVPCTGGFAAALGAHVPSPLTLHAWHVPHVEVRQHTPSTQLPL